MQQLKLLIILTFALLTFSSSAGDTKICEIYLNDNLLENYDFVSLQFYTSKKKLIKECQGIHFFKVVEKFNCDFDQNQTSSYFFIAYGKDGKKVTFSFSDISPKISKIPAFLAFREKLIIPDTVRISGISGTTITENDLKKVKQVFTYMQVYKIYLQMNSIPKDTIDKIFKNYFLIFPQDQTTDRWIGDLDKIEVYKIQG